VEVALQGGGTTFKRYLGGIALQSVVNGVVNSTKYLFHDHLGSLVRIANADGSVSEGLDYAPFGGRRSYTSPLAAGTGTTTTDRSFTGHTSIQIHDDRCTGQTLGVPRHSRRISLGINNVAQRL
jgi:hypothetical protein